MKYQAHVPIFMIWKSQSIFFIISYLQYSCDQSSCYKDYWKWVCVLWSLVKTDCWRNENKDGNNSYDGSVWCLCVCAYICICVCVCVCVCLCVSVCVSLCVGVEEFRVLICWTTSVTIDNLLICWDLRWKLSESWLV